MEGDTHRSRGRLRNLRLVACIMTDMTGDLSILCAAQMEEIDSSKEVGSSTIAEIRAFKSSILRFGLEIEVGWVDVDSGSGSGDPWRSGGVSILTTGFTYGLGRLRDKSFTTRNQLRGGGNSRVLTEASNPHNQASIVLNTIAME